MSFEMNKKIMMTALTMGIGTAAFAGTVAEWKFVESSAKPGTIADQSGNGFVLKVSGVAERMKYEKVDSQDVLTLKGSHEFAKGGQFCIQSKIPLDKFDPVKGFTFEMFFTPVEGFKREGTQTFFTNMSYGTKPGFVFSTRFNNLELFSGNGHPSFIVGGVKERKWSSCGSDSLTAFKKGDWSHVAAVYDGSNLVLYRNGIKVAESKENFKLTPGGEDYFIGSFHGGNCHGFTGSITWAKLSDKALTGEEILKSAKSIAE
jgi:hypothetical protein